MAVQTKYSIKSLAKCLFDEIRTANTKEFDRWWFLVQPMSKILYIKDRTVIFGILAARCISHNAQKLSKQHSVVSV